MQRIDVGDIQIFPVRQFRHHMTTEKLLGIDTGAIDRSAWYWQPPYFDGELRMMPVDMGGFLVRTPTHQVLVDLGVGNNKHRASPNLSDRHDNWFGELASAGASPADIDAIVITHFHVDHVGYATSLIDDEWELSFPGVPHYAGEGELEFWGDGDGRSGAERGRMGDYMFDSVLPVAEAGLLKPVGTGFEIVPGLTVEVHPGHTPGTITLVAESGGAGAIFVGDMIHHPYQLGHPGHSTTYCIDPAAAATARLDVLNRVVDAGWLLIPSHFPGTLPARVRRDGDAFRFDPVEGVQIA